VFDKNNIHYYLLNEDTSVAGSLSEDELVNAVKGISTQKKLVVTDVPSPGMMVKISESYSDVSYALNEIIFMCPGVATPVNPKTGTSVFTEQLVESVKELSLREKFTAKDLVAMTSARLGSDKYYIPVLSFAYAKDFVLYRSEQTKRGESFTRSTIDEPVNQPGNQPGAGGEGKNYALLIGTDIYKDFKKLNNAVYDVAELAHYLKNDYGFETDTLLNATKRKIQNKLIEYRDAKTYHDNDQLFIYFAGHGTFDLKEQMGYLVASDSRKDDIERSSFLSYSDLFGKYLKAIGCKRIFLVLDACHAGTFFDDVITRGDPPSKDVILKAKKNADGKKIFIGISSGDNEEVSDGNPGEHSPFARSFMSYLINQDFVTAGMLVETLKAKLPSNTTVRSGEFKKGDVGGQFIFELKTKPAVTPTINSASTNPN
jgi:Caspase domain